MVGSQCFPLASSFGNKKISFSSSRILPGNLRSDTVRPVVTEPGCPAGTFCAAPEGAASSSISCPQAVVVSTPQKKDVVRRIVSSHRRDRCSMHSVYPKNRARARLTAFSMTEHKRNASAQILRVVPSYSEGGDAE